ncbi:MAG: ribosome small subunit-dependent GTPase A, partial [Candidatus Methylumidiphilus sp.]
MKGKGRRNAPPAPKPSADTGHLPEGLVVSHLGQGLAVECPDGQILLCQTRRRLGDVAVGDRVTWTPSEDGEQGRVEAVLPRRSVLTRPGYAGKTRVVAANLDRVFVVVSASPAPDWLLVDQYLAVCEFRGIPAEIVYNKIDLAADETAALAELADYVRIGYPGHPVSARSGRGVAALQNALHGHCSMLAGQSGVGKSSLTNALLPDKNLRTGEISERSGLGRHTTTAATLYHLPGGGDLIDSPGVAVFGLAGINGQDLAWGYREFQPRIAQCRFNDCRHTHDKGCAVRAAM